jgi:hypothetical protein
LATIAALPPACNVFQIDISTLKKLRDFRVSDSRTAPLKRRPRKVDGNEPAELLLPSPLLVTIQAQLLAPFVFINFGLAALLDGTHVTIRLLKNGAMPITFFIMLLKPFS